MGMLEIFALRLFPLEQTLVAPKENVISVSELLHTTDNTGNVCIWPSEEVLAHYCAQHSSLFESKVVCELAAGASGVAGLLLASLGLPKKIYITDGNEQAAQNIQQNIISNTLAIDVESRQLVWGSTAMYEDLLVDIVIAADCLFLEQFHDDLLATLSHILKPEGMALIMAPRRGRSLEAFAAKARLRGGYDVAIDDVYDERIRAQHEQFQGEQKEGKEEKEKEEKGAKGGGKGGYNPDLHYPLLVSLKPVGGVMKVS